MANSTNQSFNGVDAFHEAFGHPRATTPTAIPLETAVKRAIWTAEEIIEFLYASVGGNVQQFQEVIDELDKGIDKAIEKSLNSGDPGDILTAQMDALTDISYFNYGSFVVAGVDPQPLFDIVQAANMAKLGEDGKPIIRESDGKIMKPEGWEPPEAKIEAEIQRQIEASQEN